ncbi:MAG: hypothetical protein CSA05_01450 [Bacteroidia bacterium]|nr:MAG: hypothetical protein CSA05_01450 [Bacteroidia bacterium]
MINNLYLVLKRELYRISKSPTLIFISLIGPIIGFLLVYWLFSAGVIRDIPIVIVDQDNTASSRKIGRLCGTAQTVKITGKLNDLNEAHSLMNTGHTEAIIYIPAETEKKLLTGNSAEIKIFINNTNLAKGGSINLGLYKTLATISAGIKIQIYQKKGKTYQQAFENVLPVNLKSHVLFNPFGNYSYFLALGLFPLMITIFTLLGTLYVVGIELKTGTAGELMQTAGNNVVTASIGKLLPYTFMFFVNVMIMNFIIFRWLGTPLKGSILWLVGSEIIMIVAYQAIALFLLALTANLRLSLSLGSAYTMMGFSFSGLTFPIMGMPWFIKLMSNIFPYVFWLNAFIGQTLKGEPTFIALKKIIILFIFIGIGIISLPLLKKKLSHEENWGKD